MDQYFPTMSQAIDKAKDEAAARGFQVVDNELLWEPVDYGKIKRRSLELVKDGKTSRKMLHVSLYRMDSGRYELVSHIG